MRKTMWLLAVLATAAAIAIVTTGCTQQSATVDKAKEQVEQKAAGQEAAVDAKLNSAQDKVKELASGVGGLEARISGLQISSDLQEVQRKLNNAIGEAADKKKAAIDELSTRLNGLIERVDSAAGKLPAGGPVRTELEDFSAKLKDVQTDLADAAASLEASATP